MNNNNSQIYKYGGTVFAGLGGLEALGMELIHQYHSMQGTLEDAGGGYTLFLTQGICMGLYGLAGIVYGKYLDCKSQREEMPAPLE